MNFSIMRTMKQNRILLTLILGLFLTIHCVGQSTNSDRIRYPDGQDEDGYYPAYSFFAALPDNFTKGYFLGSQGNFLFFYRHGEVIIVASNSYGLGSFFFLEGAYEVGDSLTGKIIFECHLGASEKIKERMSKLKVRKNRVCYLVSIGPTFCLLYNIRRKNIDKLLSFIVPNLREVPIKGDPWKARNAEQRLKR